MESIKTRITNIVKFFPAYFREYSRPVFISGLIFALIWGLWVFYKDAYSVTKDTYEVFVTDRKVNEKLVNDMVTYIDKQGSTGGVAPTQNLFVK
ncbi:MAG: hypothetical protein A3H51_01620 [Candidatus Spechtbacteria bacterium RIFCSPLOWO2_02_FULL_38_8]|uniref:Uncharacterized protein n=1 Tax=Candidatus Spechtbacteria bacterium RIFCSPLOWO2_02_FULL_38_8 TaxID=1802164 RepID=A0A1G2HJ15_9BACT|nr:MAG: hypothetical protein A3H51_01620 [Candidatus Spechtbacteria bacterium RIFCSPLOWO2_02_FULL_38_8]